MLSRVRTLLSPPPELAPQEAYRLWAKDYPPYAHNLLMEVEQRAMTTRLPDVYNTRVLDLACGTGRYARLLAAQGARVTATDFSYEMLAHSEDTLPLIQSDMTALPFANYTFDTIVCALAVGHLPDLTPALSEMSRVVVPGGTILYSDFHAAGEPLGWKRTFTDGKKTYAVKHYSRSEETHAQAVQEAGLVLHDLVPVRITADLAAADPRSAQFRARWGDTPVVLVVRAQKS